MNNPAVRHRTNRGRGNAPPAAAAAGPPWNSIIKVFSAGITLAFTIILGMLIFYYARTTIMYLDQNTFFDVRCKDAWELYRNFSLQYDLNERMSFLMPIPTEDDFKHNLKSLAGRTATEKYEFQQARVMNNCTSEFYSNGQWMQYLDCRNEYVYYEEFLEVVPMFDKKDKDSFQKWLFDFFFLDTIMRRVFKFPALGNHRTFFYEQEDQDKQETRVIYEALSTHITLPPVGQLISQSRIRFEDTPIGCEALEVILAQVPYMGAKFAEMEMDSQRKRIWSRFKVLAKGNKLDTSFTHTRRATKHPEYFKAMSIIDHYVTDTMNGFFGNDF